jgi:hypothetical protein
MQTNVLPLPGDPANGIEGDAEAVAEDDCHEGEEYTSETAPQETAASEAASVVGYARCG